MMLYVFRWNCLFISEICASNTMFQISLRSVSLLTLAVFPSVLVITESENLLGNFRLRDDETSHSEMSCLVISSSDNFMTFSKSPSELSRNLTKFSLRFSIRLIVSVTESMELCKPLVANSVVSKIQTSPAKIETSSFEPDATENLLQIWSRRFFSENWASISRITYSSCSTLLTELALELQRVSEGCSSSKGCRCGCIFF